MENVAIKGRGGNDVQHKNWNGKIQRILITIIRHGGLGHEVQESHLIDKAMTLELEESIRKRFRQFFFLANRYPA